MDQQRWPAPLVCFTCSPGLKWTIEPLMSHKAFILRMPGQYNQHATL